MLSEAAIRYRIAASRSIPMILHPYVLHAVLLKGILRLHDLFASEQIVSLRMTATGPNAARTLSSLS